MAEGGEDFRTVKQRVAPGTAVDVTKSLSELLLACALRINLFESL